MAALWTSSSALTAIIDSLNRAYDVEEGRPFWKVRGIAILLTVGLSVFIIAALVLLTFGPQLGRWVADLVGLGQVFAVTWNILRWPVIVGLLIIAMAMLYYFAPDVEQKWQWITPGSAVSVTRARTPSTPAGGPAGGDFGTEVVEDLRAEEERQETSAGEDEKAFGESRAAESSSSVPEEPVKARAGGLGGHMSGHYHAVRDKPTTGVAPFRRDRAILGQRV